MTLSMWLALAVLVVMIVLIMFDVLPFGAPPIFACILLVILGLATPGEAFSGFVNNSVIMIAGFMVVMAAIQKTSLMNKVKVAITNLTNKGGYKSYVLLIVIAMAGCALVGGGNTGYYVLILSLIATLPYTKAMPTSKLMLPMGFATNHPLIPFNVALYFGIATELLKTAGYNGEVSMFKFAVVNFFLSMGFLLWALIGYKVLPDHPINDATEEDQKRVSEDLTTMPKWQENVTYAMFIISIVGMMLVNQLTKLGPSINAQYSEELTPTLYNILTYLPYIIPGLCGAVLLFCKVLNFKECRDNMFAPVLLMMAGVIGVADALANTGFTGMVGEKMAGVLSGAQSESPFFAFMVVFVFALLTSTFATFTGSNMGSVYVFAPIAIATCIALGVNPIAAAVAVTVSGWQGGYMPIDGLPALIMGMGKYKLTEFWKFTVPMYLIRLIFLCIGAVIIFPMSAL